MDTGQGSSCLQLHLKILSKFVHNLKNSIRGVLLPIRWVGILLIIWGCGGVGVLGGSVCDIPPNLKYIVQCTLQSKILQGTKKNFIAAQERLR